MQVKDIMEGLKEGKIAKITQGEDIVVVRQHPTDTDRILIEYNLDFDSWFKVLEGTMELKKGVNFEWVGL